MAHHHVEARPPVIAFEATMMPQIIAQPGDRITFCTLDACSGEVQSEHDVVPLDAAYDPRRGGGNPCVGTRGDRRRQAW